MLSSRRRLWLGALALIAIPLTLLYLRGPSALCGLLGGDFVNIVFSYYALISYEVIQQRIALSAQGIKGSTEGCQVPADRV